MIMNFFFPFERVVSDTTDPGTIKKKTFFVSKTCVKHITLQGAINVTLRRRNVILTDVGLSAATFSQRSHQFSKIWSFHSLLIQSTYTATRRNGSQAIENPSHKHWYAQQGVYQNPIEIPTVIVCVPAVAKVLNGFVFHAVASQLTALGSCEGRFLFSLSVGLYSHCLERRGTTHDMLTGGWHRAGTSCDYACSLASF